jgi:hypothetical protein
MGSLLLGDWAELSDEIPEYDDHGFMLRFVPVPTPVPCCGDTIWSSYEGQYQSCICRGSSVDQTRHYTRSIGVLAEARINEQPVQASVKERTIGDQ